MLFNDAAPMHSCRCSPKLPLTSLSKLSDHRFCGLGSSFHSSCGTFCFSWFLNFYLAGFCRSDELKIFFLRISYSWGVTATGLEGDQIFVGDICTQYRNGTTTVDLKIDSYSNFFYRVTRDKVLPGIKTFFSFDIPDQSGKLDVQYVHDHAALFSSIGLTPSPLLEFNASVGNSDLVLGGEVGYDTASDSFTKYNAGISINKPDFSAALIMMDKAQAIKASYFHTVNPSKGAAVAAEMIHKFSNYESTFTIGSSHAVDPITLVKTRFSDNGKMAMLCQCEWRPKSQITFSVEYDTKAAYSASKLGLALALKP